MVCVYLYFILLFVKLFFYGDLFVWVFFFGILGLRVKVLGLGGKLFVVELFCKFCIRVWEKDFILDIVMCGGFIVCRVVGY